MEALSGIMGSISLVAWICVLMPQLAKNIKTRSAQGISLAFLTVWLIGDLTNLIGAVWARLVSTVIALAFYFCIADIVLILQCLYYNFVIVRESSPPPSLVTETWDDSRRPLLMPSESDLRISDSARRPAPLVKSTSGRACATNLMAILAVCVAGAAGWAAAWEAGFWAPVKNHQRGAAVRRPIGAEILGYTSAICYLGARIPQIVKNHRHKSCEGLSLLFFVLSLLGNASYGAGILLHSVEKDYITANLPWLIGSLG
ncbi:MAG: hypothetical protein Q9220_003949 [cf. Caloplaca sp. 1 TL-2023]